ncbi:replicative helicase loader/inhibitor [Bacillus smithii]|uniref:replicative helicase loader/inhibitor n=1 Tax=Bacillus smithii TaxID=1479 RepID=UPI0030CA110D
MTREELKNIFKVLVNVYPNFEVSSEKLNIWYEFLKDSDYQSVLNNTKEYVLSNRFPPSIADLNKKRESIPPYYDDFIYDINAGEDW